MSEYDNIRVKKLKLKGEKKKSKKHKHKHSKKDEAPVVDVDSEQHGHWWKVKKIEDITGAVAIEFGNHTYVKALDNGLFTLGPPHDEGDGPSPEEILTAIPINERHFALKSGYNKYLKIEKNGTVTGRSDAIGAMEQWEPVFQDNKMALQSAASTFLSIDTEEETLVAISKTAGVEQMINIRSQMIKEDVSEKDANSEEKGSLSQLEVNYVKRFQKFQDKKLRVCQEDKRDLKKAKIEGTLYETMLDRRSKMKADRYCK